MLSCWSCLWDKDVKVNYFLWLCFYFGSWLYWNVTACMLYGYFSGICSNCVMSRHAADGVSAFISDVIYLAASLSDLGCCLQFRFAYLWWCRYGGTMFCDLGRGTNTVCTGLWRGEMVSVVVLKLTCFLWFDWVLIVSICIVFVLLDTWTPRCLGVTGYIGEENWETCSVLKNIEASLIWFVFCCMLYMYDNWPMNCWGTHQGWPRFSLWVSWHILPAFPGHLPSQGTFFWIYLERWCLPEHLCQFSPSLLWFQRRCCNVVKKAVCLLQAVSV